MICITWTVLVGGFLFVMLTLLRWFEQITEAVDNAWWNKVTVLLACPFTVWFFPSRVLAGRPTPVPRHEPVRGFGTVPKAKATAAPAPQPKDLEPPLAQLAPTDQPPPGTPKEFLGLPKVPAPKPRERPQVDPEKIARLRQKMREQGMLDDDEAG